MDAFIRKELILNAGTSLENVAPHCIKLLDWLLDCQVEIQLQQKLLKLTPNLIESMMKATMYLFECHDRFGEALAERCNSHSFYATCSSLAERKQSIKELCAGIVSTRKGEAHAALLHLMHKPFADVQPAWSVIRELDWAALRQPAAFDPAQMISTDLLQMRRLVKRICRLSTLQKMETALHRALKLVGFSVWLCLFREPRHSNIHSDCHLLRHMICDMLAESQPAAPCCDFLHNMYLFLENPSNEPRFWACLDHARLSGSLIAYLIGYWNRHMPYLDQDDMQITADAPPTVTVCPALPLDEVTFLTHLLLTPRSPCREQFHLQLRSHSMASQLMELLNKVAFVYS
ncbi:uncharacterized protein [Drosophila pseudoobscura]|uniref:Uncharacterized protein n=1 Tax=Drosophila pseudoobscura pseudoobscura TaxID=46245 RepID=A0A6I8UHS7_DROPS|nr:uncharacterized protein LOC4815840 [Drosophila pseudoobscura]